MSNPPGLVKLCLESIYLILSGQETNDWKIIKAFISKDSFIKCLIEFKSENITYKTFKMKIYNFFNLNKIQLL